LRRVSGFLGIAQKAEAKRIDRPLKLDNKLLERSQFLGSQSGDQTRLLAVLD
jgi:hypothetical protein